MRYVALIIVSCIACGDDATSQNDPEDGCTGYPPQATSAYVLPWSVGETYTVTTSNCGGIVTHEGQARFAYDFGMSIGTVVVASRGGVVIGIDERFVDGNRVPGDENQVFIEHADGSVARYYHLTFEGALAELGDTVQQGDTIGLSGNTGNTRSPHLHFDVTIEDCGEPFFGPRCITLPVTFRNTRAHPEGLVGGETYTAQTF